MSTPNGMREPYRGLSAGFWCFFAFLFLWTLGITGYSALRYHDHAMGEQRAHGGVTRLSVGQAGRPMEGVFVTYYRGGNLETPLWAQVLPGDLNYNPHELPGHFPGDLPWAARITAWLEVPRSGRYRFSVNAQDGARVWIDGQLVLDEWNTASLYKDAGTFRLEPGRIPMVIEWNHRRYGGWFGLRWEGPGVEAGFVPAQHLIPDPRAGWRE